MIRREDWRPLSRQNLDGMEGRKIMVVRGDHKMYVGSVVYMSPDYVELQNGRHKQIVEFARGQYEFVPILELPDRRFQMGQPRLFRETDYG